MKRFRTVYANTLDAYNPAFWANESLQVLTENMVIGNMVHRDFSPIIQNFGDTINTRKPGTFQAKRKGTQDNVTVQDASATNVAVVLNQHVHTSFTIKDSEASKSMKDLISEFIVPSMIAQARFVDQCLLGQAPRFLVNSVGGLGTLSETNVKTRVLALREKMNINKAPVSNRQLIWTTGGETTALNVDLFLKANEVGDQGQALQEAALGRKLGFNNYMSQNASQVATGNTTKTGAVNNAGGYPIGTTTLAVDTFSGAVTTGAFVTIAGDDYPQQITAHTETTSNTTQIVITPGLRYAVADNAVVTSYVPGAVNNASGYAVGYVKEIAYDGFTVNPKVGQFVTFGTTYTTKYSIIQVTSTTILLDRPLEAALADNDIISISPAGQLNFAFLRNAMGMVIRPLALPPAPTGVQGHVVNYNGLSMRAVMTYDGNAQGTLVTLDMLWGLQVYDTDQGAILLG